MDYLEKREKVNKLHKNYGIYDIISYIFLCFYIIYLFISFCLTPTNVSGPSMEPTLKTGDRLVINQLYSQIHTGNVVVFDPTDYKTRDKDNAYIKRVLAKPGDKISYKNSHVYVNDKLDERILISSYELFRNMMSYQNECVIENNSYEVVIPKKLYILIGDNYQNSFDSSELGLIHKKDIIGKAIFRFWPFKSIGKL